MSSLSPRARISAIAAVEKNGRGIGKNGNLLWRIPDDLARFKTLTMGHPIVMGRKTFASIGRVLPGRTHIVVSQSTTTIPGCVVVRSVPEALAYAKKIDTEEIFLIGGTSIFTEGLPHTDRLYLSVIDAHTPDADTFFPDYSLFTREISRQIHSESTPPHTFTILERQ